MSEQVILVDESDMPIGTCEKLEAHQNGGKLHRAISIFIFSPKGEMLLQQRAKKKYHCGGLWANTCCSHPRPGESVDEAAHRRIKEEMGFDCELREVYSFIYRVEFDNGLTEHEYDHVLVGTWEGNPAVNIEEVEDWKWVTQSELSTGIKKKPENYAFWFRNSFEEVVKRVFPGTE